MGGCRAGIVPVDVEADKEERDSDVEIAGSRGGWTERDAEESKVEAPVVAES